ncbi:hypothetical protein QTP88_019568 [Uroleucon formosanum]
MEWYILHRNDVKLITPLHCHFFLSLFPTVHHLSVLPTFGLPLVSFSFLWLVWSISSPISSDSSPSLYPFILVDSPVCLGGVIRKITSPILYYAGVMCLASYLVFQTLCSFSIFSNRYGRIGRTILLYLFLIKHNAIYWDTNYLLDSKQSSIMEWYISHRNNL